MESRFIEHDIVPLMDMVLLEPDESEQTSPGGIVIPYVDTEDKYAGVVGGWVVALGPGLVLENGMRAEPEVKIGDYALYVRLQAVDTLSKRFLIKSDKILGIIPDLRKVEE